MQGGSWLCRVGLVQRLGLDLVYTCIHVPTDMCQGVSAKARVRLRVSGSGVLCCIRVRVRARVRVGVRGLGCEGQACIAAMNYAANNSAYIQQCRVRPNPHEFSP